MNCQQFEHLLDRYLDKELRGTLKLEFEAHMVECENCGHLYAMSEAIGQIIATPGTDEPILSEDFSERILGELEKRNHRRVALRKIFAPAGLVASVALILTSVIIFSSPTNDSGKRFASVSVKASKVKSAFEMSFKQRFADKSGIENIKDERIAETEAVGLRIGKDIVSITSKDDERDNEFHSNKDVTGSSVLATETERDKAEVEKELNSWLSQTLERAGQTVWELAELKTLAWDKMREELISSIRPTALMPAGSVIPVSPPVIDNSGDIGSSSDDKINIEQGLELI